MPIKLPSLGPSAISRNTRPARRRNICPYAPSFEPRIRTTFLRREASTTDSLHDEKQYERELDPERTNRPRWLHTPERMTAPIRTKPRPFNNEFHVNEDPKRLDQAYIRFLGDGGDKMLTEEVKWLAVTHKSFDHAKRGYNDRLGFLGKRIVELQTSLALMLRGSPVGAAPPEEDPYQREPFRHPALEGLENLNEKSRDIMRDLERLANLAQMNGIASVVRWKPKKADNLKGAGSDIVYSQALYAIIGAIALQKGGETANRITRERILNRLGLT